MPTKCVKLIFVVGLLVVAGCSGQDQVTDPAPASPDAAKLQMQLDLTPFQLSIKNRMDERASNGLPVPQVSFDYYSDNGASLNALQYYSGTPGESFTIVATTTIEYAHPNEAGLDQWPRFVFSGSVPPEQGYIREGDYTDEFIDYVAERNPGVWDTYEFGYEPRTRTITETFTVTYPEQSNLTVGDDLPHGFSIVGPDIDWTVGNEACVAGVCAWKFKAGFALDWGLGLRLPMNVELESDDPVDEGTLFHPTSVVDGVNWSASDYGAAGLPEESGNEYFARLKIFLGMQVEVAEISIIDIGPDVDKNATSSFATPFGPGQVFSLPPINAPVYQDNLPAVEFEFGVGFTPQGGSDKFTADWAASGDLMAPGGSLEYTDPNIAETLMNVVAVDGPSTGGLQISNTKYVFTQFLIGISAYLDIDIIGLFTEHYAIPIADFNLSGIFPDISVPIHTGASPTELNATIDIQNVTPTAEINVSGADVVNGVNTFFAGEGEVIPFQGSSHDPGRDDLTLQWDFGDGAPSPDASTNYPLGMPVGPNDVTEDQPYTFAEACVYQVTFKSTDSDGASSQDAVAVVIRDAVQNKTRLAGYWQHQLKRVGMVEFTEDELACLLEIVGFMSTVFDEERDASNIPSAYDVLHLRGNGGNESEKFDRELLVAWLNFANSGFELSDMVDTDGDTLPDATFAGVLAAAEMVRLDPFATDDQLHEQREIVHYTTTQGNNNLALTAGAGSRRHASDSRDSVDR